MSHDRIAVCRHCEHRGVNNPEANPAVLHILCDRDVGLFNLILSVIPHVDWAFSQRRIPVVYYGRGNCYWTPNGYRDRDTVWEYILSLLFQSIRSLAFRPTSAS